MIDILKFAMAELAATVILVAAIVGLRLAVTAAIRRGAETLDDNQRRWLSATNNLSMVFMAVGLLLIWMPALSTFALSLTAFAVAIVLATKEFLLCLVGMLYRTAAEPFEVGDWIEFEGLRGEVVSVGMFSFQVHELGQHQYAYDFTGRIVVVPNSRLLLAPVTHESYRKRFVYHNFAITLGPESDPAIVTPLVLARIAELETSYEPVARRYWSMVRRRYQAELPAPAPSVHVSTTDLRHVRYTVSLFCPTPDAIAIEQDIVTAVLALGRDSDAGDRPDAVGGAGKIDAATAT